jgi:sugar phosphate isomerase/epimerase
MPADFRFAVCSEMFGEMPFPEVCRNAQQIGYKGIELTPHLFTERQQYPRDIRDQIVDAGLAFVGIHWLLVSPPGLHITSPDPETVRKSWDHVRRMVDICAELAGCNENENGIVVIGSPKQRSSQGGSDQKRAMDLFVHELAHLAPFAESRGVTLLIEAIPSRETDVVNCLSDAVAIVRQIGSPAVETMFDVHNAADETEPDPELIRRFCSHIRHVHVNEKNGAEPGCGDYDFEALLTALGNVEYRRWVSVESFDFSRPGVEIATTAMDRLKTALEKV